MKKILELTQQGYGIRFMPCAREQHVTMSVALLTGPKIKQASADVSHEMLHDGDEYLSLVLDELVGTLNGDHTAIK